MVLTHVLGVLPDIYSYGLLLYEILHGKVAFDHSTPVGAMLQAQQGQRPPLALRPEHAHLAQLLKQCWDAEPKRRPTLDRVIAELSKAPNEPYA